jgi:hypothetical protein
MIGSSLLSASMASSRCGRYWPGAAFVARIDLVAIGCKADATGSRANDANDPKRHFAACICRIAKGSFALMWGAPGRVPSLTGQEHGQNIPLAGMSRVGRSPRRFRAILT